MWPKLWGPSKKLNEQVCLKRKSQIWRPSEMPADAGSQILFPRIPLEINMRPKLCKPSPATHQTISFKRYLPNLTAFKKSSRRRITYLVFKDLHENEYAAKKCKPSHETHQTSSFETYLPNLTACRNSSRRRTTDFIFKDLHRNTYAAQTMQDLVRSSTDKFVENVSLQSDGLQKFQPTLDNTFGFQGFR